MKGTREKKVRYKQGKETRRRKKKHINLEKYERKVTEKKCDINLENDQMN